MNTNKLLDELYDLLPYDEMLRKNYHRAEEIIKMLRVKEDEK